MRQYQSFIFESYRFDPKGPTIQLLYSLDGEVHFTETLHLPRAGLRSRFVDRELLDRALALLHHIGGVSYWKTCMPPQIHVRGAIDAERATFLTAVYQNGLGEFFFKNAIDFREKLRFPITTTTPVEAIVHHTDSPTVLVPIGGGKDSIVTLELLKRSEIPVTLLRVGGHPLIAQTAKIAGLPLITVERELSPTLFELNAQGALNGHVPITAYLHALSLIVALLYGHRAVAFSNERSAETGSVLFHGMEINHQWSKSLAFERLFQEEMRRSLTTDVPVFSLLRPVSELAIARAFSQVPEYAACSTSCNANWTILKRHPKERWCRACPKCAFSFAMFSAFLPLPQVIDMVGGNLFADASLLPLYRQLLGIEGMKPFECVGTPEETACAFLLIRARGDAAETPAMQMFVTEKLPFIASPEALLRGVLTPTTDHAIPPDFSLVLPEDLLRPDVDLAPPPTHAAR